MDQKLGAQWYCLRLHPPVPVVEQPRDPANQKDSPARGSVYNRFRRARLLGEPSRRPDQLESALYESVCVPSATGVAHCNTSSAVRGTVVRRLERLQTSSRKNSVQAKVPPPSHRIHRHRQNKHGMGST